MPSPKRFSATVNINVTLETWAALQALCETYRLLKSDEVRNMLDKHLQERTSEMPAEDFNRFKTKYQQYMKIGEKL